MTDTEREKLRAAITASIPTATDTQLIQVAKALGLSWPTDGDPTLEIDSFQPD